MSDVEMTAGLDHAFPPGMAGDAIDHEPAKRIWAWNQARERLEELEGWRTLSPGDQGKLIVGVADWLLGSKK